VVFDEGYKLDPSVHLYNKEMILILGNENEAHAAYIFDKIQARGGHPAYFDTRLFPTVTRLAFEPDHTACGFFQADPSAPKIPLSEIRAVYWRYFMGIAVEHLEDPFQRDMAFREINSTIGSLFRNLDARWVNPPAAIDMHVHKGYQLQLMKRNGIRIPQTLVTNDGDAVLEFYERLNGEVIYKPVMGGAHTRKITPEDLTPARLAELAKSPVQFQEYVPGVDIRVYLVDDAHFPAEIQSNTLDFRDDPQAQLVPITLPDSVVKDCFTVASTLGLTLTGIDVRRTPDGEYVFLEGNPSPMFIHFENITGYPISDALVDLLMR
jgi:glutathione synthase/RimK-type ligase-like ATP-grasp enzyme